LENLLNKKKNLFISNSYLNFFLKNKINITNSIIILIGIKYSGLAISAKLRFWSSIKISANHCPILANIIAHGERPIRVVKKNFELLAPSPARIKI